MASKICGRKARIVAPVRQKGELGITRDGKAHELAVLCMPVANRPVVAGLAARQPSRSRLGPGRPPYRPMGSCLAGRGAAFGESADCRGAPVRCCPS